MDKVLSEKQFTFLKELCAREAYVMIVPNTLEDDTQDVLENHRKLDTDMKELLEMGFVEDITEKFREMIETIQESDNKARTFNAYCMTELTVKMFAPNATERFS